MPHPRLALRRFVLAPLAEVAADAVDPSTGWTVAELLANLDRRPSYVAIHDPLDQYGGELFRRLVIALPADAIRQGRMRPIRWEYDRYVRYRRAEVQKRFEKRFEEQCRALDVDRWAPERCGDRWLVSDFWFDANYGTPYVAEKDRSQFRDRFLAVRGRIIAPTFVVVPQLFSQAIPRRPDEPRRKRLLFSDAPRLTVALGDPEAIVAEVLAACASTRPGRG